MKIRRVELKNFCQFDHLVFEFHRGMTCICGANGTGKSNLLNAILGALTGSFRTDGVLADNIRQKAEPDAESYVFLDVEQNGVDFRLERWLRPVRWILSSGGSVIARKSSQVSSEVFRIFGVDEHVLSEHVFVPQWQIFSFLDDSDAARTASMNRLFGLGEVQNIWRYLGEVKLAQSAPLPDVAEIRQAIVVRLERIREVDEKLSSLAEVDVSWTAVRDPLWSKIVAAERCEQLQQQLTKIRAEKDDLESRLFVLRASFESTSERSRELEAAFAACDREKEEADRDLAQWQWIEVYRRRKDELEKRVAAYERSLNELVAPEKPESYIAENDAGFWDKVSALRAEKKHAKNFISTFSGGTCVCPTCGTRMDNLEDLFAVYQERLQAVESELTELDLKWSSSRRFDQESRAYEGASLKLKAEYESILRETQNLVDAPKTPYRSVEEAQSVVERWRSLQSQVIETFQNLNYLAAQIGAMEKSLRDKQAAIAAMEKDIASLRVSDDEVALARQELQQREQSVREKVSLLKERQLLVDELDREQEQLARAEAEIRRHRAGVYLSGFLHKLRKVFHPEELPRRVADVYAPQLERRVNQLLADFDAPFRVSVGACWSWTARFPDGTQQPASRLSGGQKVVLALALRVVLNSMFASELGLICLDEPTVGLDDDNVRCLQTAMERLRDASEKKELQVVMVTHERSLDHLFDRVIYLDRLVQGGASCTIPCEPTTCVQSS